MKNIPINVDRNVSPSYFRPLASVGKLLVTSVFYTFQGEGPFAGQPAVFVRLAGCNIGAKRDCAFCDTYFAVDTAMQLTVGQLVDEVERLWPGGWDSGRPPLVVVTGGEPMLQWPMLEQFIEALGLDASVQVETNGMYLKAEHLASTADFVVSPKASTSLGAYHPNAVDAEWFAGHKHPFVKFVVSADPDSLYYDLPLAQLSAAGVDPAAVYVSGMTDYTDTVAALPDQPVSLLTSFSEDARRRTAANWQRAAELALRHGFNVSLQTHLLAGVQ